MAVVSADLLVEEGALVGLLEVQGVDFRRMVVGDTVAAAWDVVDRRVVEAVTTADDDWAWL